MKQLVEALQIFLKYGNPDCPTHCDLYQLTICGIDPADVSDEDKAELENLGFIVSNEYGKETFVSFKYGGA